jgi:hypothetical protein
VGARWIGYALVAACYSPTVPAGQPCSPNGSCPADQQCVAGTCTSAPGDAAPGDAAPNDAAPADAAPVDAPIADPTGALTGADWLMPCAGSPGSDDLCACTNASVRVTLDGNGNDVWMVAAHVHGLAELCPYSGGSALGGNAMLGGSATSTVANIYSLSISAPAQVIELNNQVGSDAGVTVLDYDVAFRVAGNATVTFISNGQDNEELVNEGSTGPISVPGVTDPAQPYDGQFIRLDVMSASLAP